MRHKNNAGTVLLFFSILLMAFFNQPTQAYAWFFDFGWWGHRDRPRGYSQVVVAGDRYYYNDGIFYTGAPGSYVVVGAPVGAVVYDIPPYYERVYIDGDLYFVYHDVYYRSVGGGYEVVERPHIRHWHGDEERDEHWEEHHR